MVKVVGIVVLSALFLGERDIFSARMVVGCTLAVLGFTMYSYACLEAQQRRRTVWVKAGAGEGVGVGSGGAKAAADPEGAPLLPTSTPARAGARRAWPIAKASVARPSRSYARSSAPQPPARRRVKLGARPVAAEAREARRCSCQR